MNLISILLWNLLLPLIVLILLFGVVVHYLDRTALVTSDITNVTTYDNTTVTQPQDYYSIYDCSCCHPDYHNDPDHYHGFDTEQEKA